MVHRSLLPSIYLTKKAQRSKCSRLEPKTTVYDRDNNVPSQALRIWEIDHKDSTRGSSYGVYGEKWPYWKDTSKDMTKSERMKVLPPRSNTATDSVH